MVVWQVFSFNHQAAFGKDKQRMSGGQRKLSVLAVLLMVQVTTSLSKPSATQGGKIKSVLSDLESKWLADEAPYNNINPTDQPQGDQAVEQQTELCPPVPAVLPEGSCNLPTCSSDRTCGADGDRRKCCYNGCIYTCLPELRPPPFFDWIHEPRRRLRSGLSWLITGPDRTNEEESCSTSLMTDDADPLLCPEGFFCSIFHRGEPDKGIPNQGVCVKVTADDDGKEQMQADLPMSDDALHGMTPGVVHDNACDIAKGWILIEGHSAVLEGHHCVCKNQKLICNEEKARDV